MSFGKRLKQLRSDKGLTQLQLSEILDTAKSNISKYEADTIEPNISMLRKLGKYFNVSIDYLLGITETKSPHRPSQERTGANKEAGGSLAYWIRKTGRSYAEVAEKVGVSESLVEDYCSGLMEPPLEVLEGLSEFCSVSTDCLLGFREKSRSTGPDGNMPFRFDPEIPRRLKSLAAQMGEAYDVIADLLGIDEDEVFNFFEYGFVLHISVFVQIVDHFLVSSDYILNRTGSTLTPQIDEEKFLRLYRSLNSEYKDIANGDLTKLKKQQEQEVYLRKASFADGDRYLDDQGKSLA